MAICILNNYKLFHYKVILKLQWSYGIQIRASDSTLNLEIWERFYSEVPRNYVNFPGFVPYKIITWDLQMKIEIGEYSRNCSLGVCSHLNRHQQSQKDDSHVTFHKNLLQDFKQYILHNSSKIPILCLISFSLDTKRDYHFDVFYLLISTQLLVLT